MSSITRPSIFWITCLFLLILFHEPLPNVHAQNTYVVNSALDNGDGVCTTSPEGCTLREAIAAANNSSGLDSISFNIPGQGPHIIAVNSRLPDVTSPVVLDATTQPGTVCPTALKIIIDGSNIGTSTDGFTINSDGSGSTIRGFIIQNFMDDGIMINGNYNTIQCNFIGTDVTGTMSMPNAGNGISIQNSASNNVIGGGSVGARNLISGNNRAGIELDGSSILSNWITGNYIGIDVTGTIDLGNGTTGIRLRSGAQNNIIGTNGDGVNDQNERNVISGNDEDGVNITASSSQYNVVAGNIIGLNASGTAAIGNIQEGVRIASNANNNRVGTNGDGVSDIFERNILSGNLEEGVEIRDPGSNSNIIAGNIIGLDISGTFAIPNAFNGVLLRAGAMFNRVGTDNDDPVEANVVSGNTFAGVVASETSDNVIQGNVIGIDINGVNAVANQLGGIILDGSTQILISNNVISGNNFAGILVKDDATQNQITQNRVWNNAGLGIDLNENGVTLNDSNDADIGGNGLQNFPVLTDAVGDTTLQIQGTLQSVANQNYTIEFFGNPGCDGSGFGEGRVYLGSTGVSTNDSGSTSFNVSGLPWDDSSTHITSTATDSQGNTSEFSKCILVENLSKTATPTPSNTPTSTLTSTPTNTPTNTPSSTPTNTPTDTPTNRPGDDATPTPIIVFTSTFTPTVEYVNELLINGDFETDSNADKIPDNWKARGTSNKRRDRIVCDKDLDNDGVKDVIRAYSGDCAFLFRGNPDGSNSKLIQRLYDFSALTHSATLTLTASIRNRNVRAGKPFGKVIIKYSDGTRDKIKLLTPDASNTYVMVEGSTVIDLMNRSIIDVRTLFFYNSTSGRFHVDNVRLFTPVE